MQQLQATGSGSDVRVAGSPRVYDVSSGARWSTVFFAVEFRFSGGEVDGWRKCPWSADDVAADRRASDRRRTGRCVKARRPVFHQQACNDRVPRRVESRPRGTDGFTAGADSAADGRVFVLVFDHFHVDVLQVFHGRH